MTKPKAFVRPALGLALSAFLVTAMSCTGGTTSDGGTQDDAGPSSIYNENGDGDGDGDTVGDGDGDGDTGTGEPTDGGSSPDAGGIGGDTVGDGDGDGDTVGDGDGDGDTVGDGDGDGDGDWPPVDNGLNASWIGGACDSAADCDHPSFSNAAVCETDGFANGFCTQSCSQSQTTGNWICPDADTAAGTPFTVTRCVADDEDEPVCVAECDFDKSSTGCRPGYACVLETRYGDDSKIYPVCMPEPDQVWPGSPLPIDDIGDSCSVEQDCENLSCLPWPDGMCTKTMCDVAGCPDGSSCVTFEGADIFACLPDCNTDNDCRAGYECYSGVDVCVPSEGSSSSDWNATVGIADCLDAWGTGGDGLSECDTDPDYYVVVNKTARNLAFCQNGSNIDNFYVALGFSPIGDKEREGDGKTPEGVFYIPRLVPSSQFYRAFLLSYPDAADAARGVSDGLITQTVANQIISAQNACTEPPQQTALGGLIEVHGEGGGQYGDWTFGCIALENPQVDALWAVLGVGDTIVVKH